MGLSLCHDFRTLKSVRAHVLVVDSANRSRYPTNGSVSACVRWATSLGRNCSRTPTCAHCATWMTYSARTVAHRQYWRFSGPPGPKPSSRHCWNSSRMNVSIALYCTRSTTMCRRIRRTAIIPYRKILVENDCRLCAIVMDCLERNNNTITITTGGGGKR